MLRECGCSKGILGIGIFVLFCYVFYIIVKDFKIIFFYGRVFVDRIWFIIFVIMVKEKVIGNEVISKNYFLFGKEIVKILFFWLCEVIL